jgi:hypothetical protein
MGVDVAMVILSKEVSPAETNLKQYLFSTWHDLKESKELTGMDNGIAMEIGQAKVFVISMPGPIPWSELQHLCASSRFWPEAASEIKNHCAHLVVTVIGKLEPYPASRLLTQVSAAALATCSGALGVYWGNAPMVIPKELFIAFATEVLPHEPPVDIWLDIQIGKVDERFTAGYTSGMTALGHLEIEVENSPESPSDLYERIKALAWYLIKNGPVIADGDTFGEDAKERIRVRFSDSFLRRPEKVMRLEYEKSTPANPWWRRK